MRAGLRLGWGGCLQSSGRIPSSADDFGAALTNQTALGKDRNSHPGSISSSPLISVPNSGFGSGPGPGSGTRFWSTSRFPFGFVYAHSVFKYGLQV